MRFWPAAYTFGYEHIKTSFARTVITRIRVFALRVWSSTNWVLALIVIKRRLSTWMNKQKNKRGQPSLHKYCRYQHNQLDSHHNYNYQWYWHMSLLYHKFKNERRQSNPYQYYNQQDGLRYIHQYPYTLFRHRPSLFRLIMAVKLKTSRKFCII